MLSNHIAGNSIGIVILNRESKSYYINVVKNQDLQQKRKEVCKFQKSKKLRLDGMLNVNSKYQIELTM